MTQAHTEHLERDQPAVKDTECPAQATKRAFSQGMTPRRASVCRVQGNGAHAEWNALSCGLSHITTAAALTHFTT